MKIKLIITLITSPFFILSQNVFDKVAASKKAHETSYIKEAIASSNAFAYKHKTYVSKTYSKIVYFINTDDEKTNNILKKEFKGVGIEATNFNDLDCDNCETGELVQKFINNKGYESILQITITSENWQGSTLVTNYYQTYGGAVSYSSFTTWSSVNVVFEWYDNQFTDYPFLTSQAYKKSRFGKYYSLISGDIILCIRGPIKKSFYQNKK